MQPPPPEPATALDQNLNSAFHLISAIRLQGTIINDATVHCLEKCTPMDELYTCDRAKMPIRTRLALDSAEKDCVANCSSKWDESIRRAMMKANQREINGIQARLMLATLMAAGGGGPPPK